MVSSNPSINARNPPAAKISPAVLVSFPLQSLFNFWPIHTPLHPDEDVEERGRSRSPKSRQSRSNRRCGNFAALFPRTFRTQCSASNAFLEATAIDSGENGAILWLWIDFAVRKVGGMSSNAVRKPRSSALHRVIPLVHPLNPSFSMLFRSSQDCF